MRIERCLDGMLDFCFDDEVLLLYKKLCRYYFDTVKPRLRPIVEQEVVYA